MRSQCASDGRAAASPPASARRSGTRARARPPRRATIGREDEAGPWPGETSRPRWPSPHGSEKRAPLPLNPCAQRRAEVRPLVREHERGDGRRPGHAAAGCAAASGPRCRRASTATSATSAWRAATARARGRPGAAGPDGRPPRPATRKSSAAHRNEHRRGVLPERLAGGPDAGAEREQRPPSSAASRCGRRRPTAQEQDGGGERRRRATPPTCRPGRVPVSSSAKTGARGERRPARPARRRARGRSRRGARPTVRANGSSTSGILVEVEVALLDQAGRDALGRPRVAGADGPAVRRRGAAKQDAGRRAAAESGEARRRARGGGLAALRASGTPIERTRWRRPRDARGWRRTAAAGATARRGGAGTGSPRARARPASR